MILKQPSPFMILCNLTQLAKSYYALMHDRRLVQSVINLLHTYGLCRTSVNNRLIVLDRHKQALAYKQILILCNRGSDLILDIVCEMTEIKFCI